SDRALALADIAQAQLAVHQPEEALANAEAAVRLARELAAEFPHSYRVGVTELTRCRVLLELARPAGESCSEAERNLKSAIGEDAPLTRGAGMARLRAASTQ